MWSKQAEAEIDLLTCSTGACSCGGGWGSDYAYAFGIPAYSNGGCTGGGSGCGTCSCGCATAGDKFQCVEFGRRFMKGFWHVCFPGVNAAKDIYNEAGGGGGWSSFHKYPNNGEVAPQPADLLLSTSQTWGHVAVVKGVFSNKVVFVDQNWSEYNGEREVTLDTGGATYYVGQFGSNYPVAGWVRGPNSVGQQNGTTSAMTYLKNEGVISSTSYPNKLDNKAEFVKMLVLAIEDVEGALPETSEPFSDVDSNDWFYVPVRKAYAAGLISYNSKFYPSNFVPRIEAAKMLGEAMVEFKCCDLKSGYAFTDVPTNEWYSDHVKTLKHYGITSGYNGQYFRPHNNVARFITAAFLEKYMKLSSYCSTYWCGNGICEEGENCSSCSMDCPTCEMGTDWDESRSEESPALALPWVDAFKQDVSSQQVSAGAVGDEGGNSGGCSTIAVAGAGTPSSNGVVLILLVFFSLWSLRRRRRVGLSGGRELKKGSDGREKEV